MAPLKITIEVVNTPQMREVLRALSLHAGEDEAVFFDENPELADAAMKAAAYRAFEQAVARALAGL